MTSNHYITNEGAKRIAKAIQVNTSLYQLDILLSECLKENSILQELNIANNEISNNGITYIGKAL